MKIALDVMGGDRGPAEIVQGALKAVESTLLPAADLILVGKKPDIEAALKSLGKPPDLFPIVHAGEVIGMDEGPVEALRKKPDNSLSHCMRLIKEGVVQGTISAGHTGGAVAAAMMMLRPLEGIRRPGIAVLVDGASGPFCVIDVGANPQPKALHLAQYGIMGAALIKHAHGRNNPRVGLMNIGTEDKKGNEFTRDVRNMFRRTRLNFIGNIEGNDVFAGKCDVIVTDGFVGNVLLKVSEGLAEHLFQVIQSELMKVGEDPARMKKILTGIHQHIDYTEYGGALLLGIEGTVIICHGRSDSKAIRNAVKVALTAVNSNVNQHIVAGVKEFGPLDQPQGANGQG